MQRRCLSITSGSPDIERNEGQGKTHGAKAGPPSRPTGLNAPLIVEKPVNPKYNLEKKISVIPFKGKPIYTQKNLRILSRAKINKNALKVKDKIGQGLFHVKLVKKPSEDF